eukprot:3935247-Rhodomonas_salina.3
MKVQDRLCIFDFGIVERGVQKKRNGAALGGIHGSSDLYGAQGRTTRGYCPGPFPYFPTRCLHTVCRFLPTRYPALRYRMMLCIYAITGTEVPGYRMVLPGRVHRLPPHVGHAGSRARAWPGRLCQMHARC